MLPKSGGAVEHLWVIIAAPDPVTNVALMVNITTQQAFSDTTTVLNVGDHPFIQHPSVAFYGDAREVNVSDLFKGLQGNVLRPQAHCPRALMDRLQKGLAASKFTPKKIKLAFALAASQGRI